MAGVEFIDIYDDDDDDAPAIPPERAEQMKRQQQRQQQRQQKDQEAAVARAQAAAAKKNKRPAKKKAKVGDDEGEEGTDDDDDNDSEVEANFGAKEGKSKKGDAAQRQPRARTGGGGSDMPRPARPVPRPPAVARPPRPPVVPPAARPPVRQAVANDDDSPPPQAPPPAVARPPRPPVVPTVRKTVANDDNLSTSDEDQPPTRRPAASPRAAPAPVPAPVPVPVPAPAEELMPQAPQEPPPRVGGEAPGQVGELMLGDDEDDEDDEAEEEEEMMEAEAAANSADAEAGIGPLGEVDEQEADEQEAVAAVTAAGKTKKASAPPMVPRPVYERKAKKGQILNNAIINNMETWIEDLERDRSPGLFEERLMEQVELARQAADKEKADIINDNGKYLPYSVLKTKPGDLERKRRDVENGEDEKYETARDNETSALAALEALKDPKGYDSVLTGYKSQQQEFAEAVAAEDARNAELTKQYDEAVAARSSAMADARGVVSALQATAKDLKKQAYSWWMTKNINNGNGGFGGIPLADETRFEQWYTEQNGANQKWWGLYKTALNKARKPGKEREFDPNTWNDFYYGCNTPPGDGWVRRVAEQQARSQLRDWGAIFGDGSTSWLATYRSDSKAQEAIDDAEYQYLLYISSKINQSHDDGITGIKTKGKQAQNKKQLEPRQARRRAVFKETGMQTRMEFLKTGVDARQGKAQSFAALESKQAVVTGREISRMMQLLDRASRGLEDLRDAIAGSDNPQASAQLPENMSMITKYEAEIAEYEKKVGELKAQKATHEAAAARAMVAQRIKDRDTRHTEAVERIRGQVMGESAEIAAAALALDKTRLDEQKDFDEKCAAIKLLGKGRLPAEQLVANQPLGESKILMKDRRLQGMGLGATATWGDASRWPLASSRFSNDQHEELFISIEQVSSHLQDWASAVGYREAPAAPKKVKKRKVSDVGGGTSAGDADDESGGQAEAMSEGSTVVTSPYEHAFLVARGFDLPPLVSDIGAPSEEDKASARAALKAQRAVNCKDDDGLFRKIAPGTQLSVDELKQSGVLIFNKPYARNLLYAHMASLKVMQLRAETYNDSARFVNVAECMGPFSLPAADEENEALEKIVEDVLPLFEAMLRYRNTMLAVKRMQNAEEKDFFLERASTGAKNKSNEEQMRIIKQTGKRLEKLCIKAPWLVEARRLVQSENGQLPGQLYTPQPFHLPLRIAAPPRVGKSATALLMASLAKRAGMVSLYSVSPFKVVPIGELQQKLRRIGWRNVTPDTSLNASGGKSFVIKASMGGAYDAQAQAHKDAAYARSMRNASADTPSSKGRNRAAELECTNMPFACFSIDDLAGKGSNPEVARYPSIDANDPKKKSSVMQGNTLVDMVVYSSDTMIDPQRVGALLAAWKYRETVVFHIRDEAQSLAKAVKNEKVSTHKRDVPPPPELAYLRMYFGNMYGMNCNVTATHFPTLLEPNLWGYFGSMDQNIRAGMAANAKASGSKGIDKQVGANFLPRLVPALLPHVPPGYIGVDQYVTWKATNTKTGLREEQYLLVKEANFKAAAAAKAGGALKDAPVFRVVAEIREPPQDMQEDEKRRDKDDAAAAATKQKADAAARRSVAGRAAAKSATAAMRAAQGGDGGSSSEEEEEEEEEGVIEAGQGEVAEATRVEIEEEAAQRASRRTDPNLGQANPELATGSEQQDLNPREKERLRKDAITAAAEEDPMAGLAGGYGEEEVEEEEEVGEEAGEEDADLEGAGMTEAEFARARRTATRGGRALSRVMGNDEPQAGKRNSKGRKKVTGSDGEYSVDDGTDDSEDDTDGKKAMKKKKKEEKAAREARKSELEKMKPAEKKAFDESSIREHFREWMTQKEDRIDTWRSKEVDSDGQRIDPDSQNPLIMCPMYIGALNNEIKYTGMVSWVRRFAKDQHLLFDNPFQPAPLPEALLDPQAASGSRSSGRSRKDAAPPPPKSKALPKPKPPPKVSTHKMWTTKHSVDWFEQRRKYGCAFILFTTTLRSKTDLWRSRVNAYYGGEGSNNKGPVPFKPDIPKPGDTKKYSPCEDNFVGSQEVRAALVFVYDPAINDPTDGFKSTIEHPDPNNPMLYVFAASSAESAIKFVWQKFHYGINKFAVLGYGMLRAGLTVQTFIPGSDTAQTAVDGDGIDRQFVPQYVALASPDTSSLDDQLQIAGRAFVDIKYHRKPTDWEIRLLGVADRVKVLQQYSAMEQRFADVGRNGDQKPMYQVLKEGFRTKFIDNVDSYQSIGVIGTRKGDFSRLLGLQPKDVSEKQTVAQGARSAYLRAKSKALNKDGKTEEEAELLGKEASDNYMSVVNARDKARDEAAAATAAAAAGSGSDDDDL